jgi:hypothetical protein
MKEQPSLYVPIEQDRTDGLLSLRWLPIFLWPCFLKENPLTEEFLTNHLTVLEPDYFEHDRLLKEALRDMGYLNDHSQTDDLSSL